MSNLRIESVSSLSTDEVLVKSEPVDTEYEQAYQQSPEETNGHTSIANPSQNIRSILNNMLDQDKELTVKSVIDDLLQRNNFLLEQVDASIYKPQPRNTSGKKYDEILKTKYADHPAVKSQTSLTTIQGQVLRPGSPTSACTIPKKDIPQMSQSLMEIGVLGDSLLQPSHREKEIVSGVASKAYVMTNEGVNMQSDLQFYWCNFCTFKTESKDLLVQHVIEHRFHCKSCSYQSFSRADVIRHSCLEHEDFKDTARALKFCSFSTDYEEMDSRKRKIEETERPRPVKKFKSAAQKEKEKSKKKAASNAEEYDAFDMEVDEVEEERSKDDEETERILFPRARDKEDTMSQETSVSYTSPVTSNKPEASKQPLSNMTSTSTTKSGSTLTVSSGLCWNCGYCDFVTLSQTFLKTHLNTQHNGKAHKYVAMLVSSQEELNKIKEKDALVYSTPNHPSQVPRMQPIAINPAFEEKSKVEDNSSASGQKADTQIDSEDDEEYIPEDEKKKYPLTYKCAHCNFNAPVCFKIKEHLQMKHMGCVLYALDMRAIKLKQRRYVFFCHRNNCSFTTKKTEEYLSHSESCTPWMVENCPEKIDPLAKKCLELTRSFSSKISQKAFQMAKNFKSNKTAEYACVHCSYTTNNNTRLKKHVLSNHREKPTIMKDLHADTMGKKNKVFFCKHCLWESRNLIDLQDHLQSKHDDTTAVRDINIDGASSLSIQHQVKTTSHTKHIEPKRGSKDQKSRSSSPTYESEISDTIEENEDDDEIQPEDLEVSEEEVQKMMDEYVKDEASLGRSPGRPLRKASAEASVRVRAQGQQPPMYRCMHCYHMCFGVNLMRKHILKRHVKEPLRAIDVKKMMARQFAYFCFCPKALCKFFSSTEQQVISHATQEHGMKEEDANLKSLLLPFTPQMSTAPPSTSREVKEPLDYDQFTRNSSAYECLYCSIRTIEHTVQSMKSHIEDSHPSEEIIFRDCLARKLKKSSRIFMCAETNCDMTYAEQKEFELHKLAHQNAHIYECTMCQWFTASSDSITSHMTNMHKGETKASTIEIHLHLDADGQVIKRVNGTVIKQEPTNVHDRVIKQEPIHS